MSVIRAKYFRERAEFKDWLRQTGPQVAQAWNMSIREHRHCCEGRWALGYLFLLFKNVSLDNFLCYLILFIGNSKCRQWLKFTIKWNRYWQVFLICDDIKNRPKTTFFGVNAWAQWLSLNTGSLTLHLPNTHVSKESSKPSVESVFGSRQ